LRPISLMTKHLAQAALRSIDKACKIVANAADQVDDPAENARAKAVAAKMKRSARSPATSATTWARPAGKDSVMSQTKEAVQRKRRSKAVPVLGATGLSLSLASGAFAATGGLNPETDPAALAPVSQQAMDEEDISNVSLATFHVFDGESTVTQRPSAGRAMAAGACGIGLYYPQNTPALAGPVYQPPPPSRPRPIRPTHKYKRSRQ
jgi:hypothetical protein